MNLEEAAKLSHSDWQQRAAELKKTAETRLFIGGEFVDAIEGGTFENICPVDGSVWTDNYRRAMRFVREIECGTFLVNSFEEGDMTQPFDGYKQSGNAKDKCFESLLSYTNTKAAWFRLN
jgi:acyl-CoA reductase-like NAD-dependent aldehyde dehydrogenase